MPLDYVIAIRLMDNKNSSQVAIQRMILGLWWVFVKIVYIWRAGIIVYERFSQLPNIRTWP